jgi:GAF domain-containing protein
MDSKKINELAIDWLEEIKEKYLKEDYTWVGIYWIENFINPEATTSTDLVLGPYIGFETPHTRISVQKGLCGRAIRENKTLNIEDVSLSPEYLSCSLETQSEIVIPLRFTNGVPFGELDIDARKKAAFPKELEKILEAECQRISKLIQKNL